MKKLLSFNKTKLFWMYFVAAVIFLLGALIVAPIWSGTDVFFKDWGRKIIEIFIAVLIIIYLCTYLRKKVARGGNGVVKVLTLVEFTLLAIIALGCILSQFKIFSIGEPFQILGLIMWCRGAVEIFRAYYFHGGTTVKYPVWLVAVAIALVTFGTYLFVKPPVSATFFQWLLAGILLICMIVCIYAGIVTKPEKKAKATK
ncbi:MAG: hypothetical protein IJW19_00905 [Clostridia bacterium]|nr:hypothetical protein [Clostridia bacterium]